MNNRAKKQHFVPRFYLKNFTDEQGELWTYDSQQDTFRQTTPENTGYETNIYTPSDENGKRIDFVEEQLSKIEGRAAEILPDLLTFRKLDLEAKTEFAYFLATMFARSPAQLRQYATFHAEIAHWAGSVQLESENRQKLKDGFLTDDDRNVEDFLLDKNNYTIDVDRRVGLVAFEQSDTLAKLMVQMNWTFELSEKQELLTSDNCVFWVNGGPARVTGPYGFGLGHRQAVIPFPLNPTTILRLDWLPGEGWSKHRLVKRQARLSNQYQAKYKNRFLYFKTRDEGFRKLGMKYAEPVNNLDSGVDAPKISVVRKL